MSSSCSEPPKLVAEDFDQTCTVNSDCVGVLSAETSPCCLTRPSAVNVDDEDAFYAAFPDEQCNANDVEYLCPVVAKMRPICDAGTCVPSSETCACVPENAPCDPDEDCRGHDEPVASP